jgi:hypothetical protein
MGDGVCETYLGRGPRQMVHYEHWSCPDAETFLTGVDYYDHPRQCRLRLRELYPQLRLGIPASDDPKPRPTLTLEGDSANSDRHTVRWGESESGTFLHGEQYFRSAEEVFAFSPLAKGDFTGWPVVEAKDYRDEEALYRRYRQGYPAEWGDRAPTDSSAGVGFYNTMFMWPLLTFGWELFLECALDPRFARVMDEFRELNRRVFRVFARLPVNFVVCHDDIVTSRGPVCSPAWMNRYIYPAYEEFWGLLRASGKRVIFMADGNMDQCAANVMACGATGFVTEPYTDFKALARRYPDCVLAGEGDNRVLYRNQPAEIRAMVERMAETGRLSGGYFMCIGNHIPWNVPPAAIKLYLDLSAELARR